MKVVDVADLSDHDRADIYDRLRHVEDRQTRFESTLMFHVQTCAEETRHAREALLERDREAVAFRRELRLYAVMLLVGLLGIIATVHWRMG